MSGKILLAFVMLVMTGGALWAQTPKAPEGDTGIASKYLGDVGIANDPSVIYATSFDDGIKAPLRKNRKGVSILSDPKIARTGAHCAQITATRRKDTGGDLKIMWENGVEQCFVRVYVKFHKDTAMPHHFVNIGGHTPTYKYRWGGAAGLRPPGGQHGAFGTTLEPPKLDKPEGGWHFYTYWHEMRSWQTPHGASDGRRNAYYGNGFNPDNQRKFVGRGKWICLEYMVKLNTIGKHDGEQAFWIDGKKVGHWGPGFPIGSWMRATFHTSGFWNKDPKPFEGFSWRSHEMLKINKASLQWYLSDRTWKQMKVDENIVYFDNFVIAKNYVGPVATKKAEPKPEPKPGPKNAPAAADPEENAKGLDEKEAGRLYQMARRAERMGQRDVAKRLYGQIVEKFPETSVAEKARARSR